MSGLCSRYCLKRQLLIGASSVGTVQMLAILTIVFSGCAATEHHFTPTDLPRELQAEQWQSPRTIDLSANVAAQITPRIAAGDVVEVTLGGEPIDPHAPRVRAIVAPDGTVDLAEVGRVSVVTGQLKRQPILLASAEMEANTTPEIHVSLVRERQNHITVSGAVEKPGVYALPRTSSDLVSALAIAGGMSRDAGFHLVIQHRTDEQNPRFSTNGTPTDIRPQPLRRDRDNPSLRQEVDLSSATQVELAGIQLQDGDVVVLERHEPPAVIVQGLVRKVGRYEFPIGEEFRILDAIACAQGMSNKVVDTVHVCRVVPGKDERAVIAVSLRAASRNQQENIVLLPGDIVSAEPNTSLLFQDGVKYLGAAAMGVASAVAR